MTIVSKHLGGHGPFVLPLVTPMVQKRSFQMQWLEECKWLAYSEIHEKVTVQMVCCVRLHLMLSAKALGMLVKSAHKNWKKAKEDKFCAETFDAFLKLSKNKENVDVRNVLSNSRKKIIDQTKLSWDM